MPQAWLTLRTRQVEGISTSTYLALTVGVLLWLLYGLSQHDWALVIANGITLPLAGCILGTKLHVRWQERRSQARSAAAVTAGAAPAQ